MREVHIQTRVVACTGGVSTQGAPGGVPEVRPVGVEDAGAGADDVDLPEGGEGRGEEGG